MSGWLCEAGVWLTWCDSLDHEYVLVWTTTHAVRKLCPHKSTGWGNKRGLKYPACTLLSLKPRVEGQGWVWIYIEERKGIFWDGSLAEGFLWLMRMSQIDNMEPSHFWSWDSILTDESRTKVILDLRVSELPLLLAQRDLRERLLLVNREKESRTRAEDSWTNPRPTISSL